MRVRRSVAARFWAVCVILLIVSPVTAPFQTFDLSAPVSKMPMHSASADKLAKQALTHAAPTLAPPGGPGVRVAPEPSEHAAPPHRVQLILRL